MSDPFPECAECGDTYSLRDGCDPSTYCDECAHKVAERLTADNARLRELIAVEREPNNERYQDYLLRLDRAWESARTLVATRAQGG